jgi:anti-sigma B factor antagonist
VPARAAVVVRPTGLLRAGRTAEELDADLARAVRESAGAVVLDLTGVTMLDSTALGVVAGCGRDLHAAGRELYLAGPNDRIRLLLKLTQLEGLFPIVGSVEAALEAPPNAV